MAKLRKISKKESPYHVAGCPFDGPSYLLETASESHGYFSQVVLDIEEARRLEEQLRLFIQEATNDGE